MTSKEIKKLLIDKEITVTKMSKDLNLSRQYISMVINGKKESKEARKKIIDYLSAVK